ncbi:MAG: NAD(P)-dependent oxidoreductase [Chitinophagales bacterium]|nr:NAD(P)-dependent oxidoreductase [Chitinophagales bacterium]
MRNLHLGIIREEKTPPDSRVALTPQQCAEMLKKYPGLEIKVQSSATRCYTDDEYRSASIAVVDDVSDCDVLIGIKEVPVDKLVANKTYLIFSHTHKKQAHNRKLLQAVLDKNIHLIDYELLTDEQGIRVIAFGYYAGLVGAHNAIMTWGKRKGGFELGRAHTYHDFEELKQVYQSLKLPPMKIVVTGAGRVAKGVVEVLDLMNIERIDPDDFLEIEEVNKPIYTQVDSDRLYAHNYCMPFTFKHFFSHPQEYHSMFRPFYESADLMINAIYWDQKAPRFFTKQEMDSPDFRIEVIADITCDIEGSVPSTIRSTTIAEPIMGYDPHTGKETKPFTSNSIDIMAIDNLPNELPRDASQAFGQMLGDHVLDELLGAKEGNMISRATIAENGQLAERFKYLKGFLEGKS